MKKAAPDEATAAVFDAAWGTAAPSTNTWTARPWVHPQDRVDEAKSARKRVPRATHAAFEPRAGRDPIAILNAQEADRLQELVPLRHARMAESAFAYYRGTPAVMAFDLANAPGTDIEVQICGDAHLSNFGLFASPERALVFDANDFDETLPGPWEWDVKRLAASMVIAGRANGFSAAENRAAAMAAVRGYRGWMGRFAGMRLSDIWYSSITDADIRESAEAAGMLQGGNAEVNRRRQALESVFSKARRRDGMKAFESLTAVVGGRRVILDDPPVITHVEIPGGAASLEKIFTDYRATMPEGRRAFLERYRFVDFALKVVGVGSVGTRCFVVLLEGRDENDALILQAKEATASVLEPYLGGERAREPRPARRGRPAADAGGVRHLPRLDPRPGWPRLLLPPAVGHEGLGRHDDPAAAGPGASTAASAAGRSPGRMPGPATPSRSPPTSGPATSSTARSPTSRRPTRT